MNDLETKHGDELLARLVMRAVLGAPVIQHDDQSRQGMYDLVVNYPDGRWAAAEVVSTRDPDAMGLSAAAMKIGYVRRPELAKMWVIVADSGARLKKLARAAPGLLAQLERDGVEQLLSFRDPWPPELRALGAARCWSHSPTQLHPPGFYLNPIPSGAIVGDGDDAVRACDEFWRAIPDVPAKLLASGMTERHAVVVVTVDWTLVGCRKPILNSAAALPERLRSAAVHAPLRPLRLPQTPHRPGPRTSSRPGR